MKLYELYDLLVKNYETSSIKKDMDLILNIEKQKYNLDLTKFKAEYIQKYDTLPTPNITCGILTFNEERCVDRCLKSVYNIFDEIIVLDSYSTDRTVELINESYPKVKVYQEKWRDDFSFHRNRIMQLATKDWIFFIDADNWLENKETNSIPRIAKLIEFLNIECVVSPIIKESNNHIHYDNRKMIKISSGIKYYGLVHEEPLLENKQTIPYNLTLKVLLNHDGYESKAVNQQDKNLRNLTLTRKMIEIDSQNPKWFYFLANELKNYDEIQNKSKVIELLENSIKMYEAHPKLYRHRYLLESILLLIEVLFNNKQYSKIAKYLDRLTSIAPNNVDSSYYKSLLIIEDMDKKVGILIDQLELLLEGDRISFFNSSKDQIRFIIILMAIRIFDLKKLSIHYNSLTSEKIKKLVADNIMGLSNSINPKV